MDREAILVYHRLIRQDPVAPDAPFLQSRIVTMAGRMGKKDVAVQQAHVFVKILVDFEASPRGQDPANAKLTAEARSTAENTLRYLALRYHNEWKKTDDQAVAGFAISVYTDYLRGLRREPLGLRDALLPRRAALRPGQVRRGRRRVRPGGPARRGRHGGQVEAGARRRDRRQGRQVVQRRPGGRALRPRGGGQGPAAAAGATGRPQEAAGHGPAAAQAGRGLPALRPLAARRQAGLQGGLPQRQALLRPLRLRRGHRSASPGWPSTTPAPRRRSTPPTWCSTPTTSWATGGT